MNRAMDIYVEALTHRNEVLGEGVVDLVRATTRSTARLLRSAQTERQRRLWTRKLDRLNDRLLRDIGIARHEIPSHVSRHLAEHAVASERPSLFQRAGRAARAIWRRLQAWQDVRVTARQLRRLDDRQLADIGLQAGNIEWFARDLALRSLAAPAAANDNRDRTAA
jgi:uncharacterized protein YjiS (DUF1127 family)